MKRHLRSGFTLVELLVVITIIGMLMALLLPAVNSARESGRRADCLSQMRQLAIATRSFESRNTTIPGYLQNIAGAQNRPANWTVMLFPFMDRTDVWTRWSNPSVTNAQIQQNDCPYMDILVCKSDPPESQTSAFLSYVANCGISDSAGTERNANGVFFNRTSAIANPISMSFDPGLFPDGLSNTLLFSENIQANVYGAAGASMSAAVAEQSTGFVWDATWNSPTTSPTDARRINGDRNVGPTHSGINYSRPSSFHPGGVNIAMCGGEALWLREEIDYRVYQQLMTPNGEKSSMPAANKILLNDKDWK